MPESPLITIITVCFNAEKSIETTLRSLENQTYREFEYLIIDGGSDDKTLELVNESKIPIQKLISEPDNGLYDAMNKGLKLAKGKYVLFLNAGDSFYSNDTLLHYKNEAEKDSDIIYGDTDIVDCEGHFISKRHLSAPQALQNNSFLEGMTICHQAFMVKKELTESFDLRYKFSADYDWCIKCIKKSTPENCFNLNEVTINYLHAGLTDKNKLRSLKERFNIMCRHYGLPKTLIKHFQFIFRALQRGSI